MTTPADQPDLIAWLRNVLDQRAAEARLLCELAGVADTGTWLRTLLAEVDAKRRILDAGNPREAYELPGEYIRFGDWQSCSDNCPGDVWHEVVKLLALPYADRPGYRDEWRP